MRSLAISGFVILGSGVLAMASSGLTAGEPRASLQVAAPDSVVLGVFVGRTPCGPAANAFTDFPAANCEKIKWELTLYRDRSTGAPAGYLYRGTRSTRRGAWSVSRGAAHDPNAVVYQLRYGSNELLGLMPVGGSVLVMLDHDMRVLVGDASWSYTLNRTGT